MQEMEAYLFECSFGITNKKERENTKRTKSIFV